MLKKFRGGAQGPNKDESSLLRDQGQHKKEWLAAAQRSECASNLESVLGGLGRSRQEIDRFKSESFDKIYEDLGAEVDGSDLLRALVVRNEKFGRKTRMALALLTLGFFLCFSPRDDTIVVVLTRQGKIVQLKVDRAACCPSSILAQFFVFMKYMGMFCAITLLPVFVLAEFNGVTFNEELHDLHVDGDGLMHVPTYAAKHRFYAAMAGAVAMFVIYAFMPHDYRDKRRRRHVLREVAASQYVLRGWTCRRRSSIKLFFGVYPNMQGLDLAGNLGNASCCGPVRADALLSSGRPSKTVALMIATLVLSVLSGLDTFITWTERSIAMEHAARAQAFCRTTSSERQCNLHRCIMWGKEHNLDVGKGFCEEVHWVESNDIDCLRFGRPAPCCSGCQKGAYQMATASGTWETFKSVISMGADMGTLLFTYLAAKYALSLIGVSDHIDILIKKRSKGALQKEIAKFDNTHPVAVDFLTHVYSEARRKESTKKAEVAGGGAAAAAGGARGAGGAAGAGGGGGGGGATAPEAKTGGDEIAVVTEEEAKKWCGVHHYDIDDATKDWETFFEKELLSPDMRFNAKAKVPKHCLGIAHDEQVLAAWTELPLLPLSMSLTDFITGGLIYDLLPLGRTRHAIIVTDRRIFYVRYRRPQLPIKWLGIDLRIDCFRHDRDIFYGRMCRTKINPLHRLVHQIVLKENFLPGVVAFQCKFGALEIQRAHGDVLDVYNAISFLTRNTDDFISRSMIEEGGINWARCQENAQATLERRSNLQWAFRPQPDDTVEPKPDVRLRHAGEQVVFHTSFKDSGSVLSGCYSNIDVVITTGRVFLWERDIYKRWDCEACLYYMFFWRGWARFMANPRHLNNNCSFFTLPSVLSFSTDLAVDPPSWLTPHHQPLKCPCFETLGYYLTDGRSRESKGYWRFSCLPRRTGPSCHVDLIWRLKTGAYSDGDFVIAHCFSPYQVDGALESDEEENYGGFRAVDELEASGPGAANVSHEERVEALRKIMCVVQDQCQKVLGQIDVLYDS